MPETASLLYPFLFRSCQDLPPLLQWKGFPPPLVSESLSEPQPSKYPIEAKMSQDFLSSSIGHLLCEVAEPLEDSGIAALPQLFQLDVGIQPAIGRIPSKGRESFPSRSVFAVKEDLWLWARWLFRPHDHLVHLLLDLLVEKPGNRK